jgi:hypothetical protein
MRDIKKGKKTKGLQEDFLARKLEKILKTWQEIKSAPKALFVYDAMRPDDDSGLELTKICEGMDAKKAIVKDCRLFDDCKASAVLVKPGHHIVGFILSHYDKKVFRAKLR